MNAVALLLCLLLFCSYPLPTSAANSAECKALESLYHKTNGKNWFTNGNPNAWLSSPDCCTWAGVNCHEDHVTSLHLGNVNMRGTLPTKWIEDIPHLETIFLGHNKLSGQLPILRSSHLTQVYLDHNSFSGSIPTYIFEYLPNIDTFSAHHNHLTGQLPPGLLDKVKNLDLDFNHLVGFLPTDFGSNLLSLKLKGNEISGEIPKEIGNSRHLIKLNLEDNDMSGSLPKTMYKLKVIKEINLSFNHFSGKLIDWSRFLSLHVLKLDQNQFTGFTEGDWHVAFTECSLKDNPFRCPLPRWTLFCSASCAKQHQEKLLVN